MAATKNSRNTQGSPDTVTEANSGDTSAEDFRGLRGTFKGKVVLSHPIHGMSASVAGEERDIWSTEEYPSLRVYIDSDFVWLCWPVSALGMYSPQSQYWKTRCVPMSNIAGFVPENDTPPAWLIK